MAKLGPFTGDASKAVSYLYGPHWRGEKGYKVAQGDSRYNHRFGGQTWDVPVCINCKEPYHQILTFDLNDPWLKEIGGRELLFEIPLISCLNCSICWEPQVFSIDSKAKKIGIISDMDTQKWKQEDDCSVLSPLPEVKVTLIEMDKEDIPTDSDHYYSAMERLGSDYICRLLGAPLYEQNPIDRECPRCKKEMKYIAAIRSQPYGEIGKVIEGVDFFIGEMTLYFMFCEDCMYIKTECQGT